MSERMVFIGATRGLGLSVLRHSTNENPALSCYSVSRKPAAEPKDAIKYLHFDMSKEETLESFLGELKEINPHRIFYFPGGGPFGSFQAKDWSSQKWSLQVTLLTPMFLAYKALSSGDLPGLKQLVFIGSQVADDSPDPGGASYAAAKHGLRGFVTSLGGDKGTDLDIRLFRPSYMDTGMLPKNSWPRQSEHVDLESPDQLAPIFWSWVQNPDGPQVFTTS